VPVIAHADSLDTMPGSAAHAGFTPLGLLDRHEIRSDDISLLSHWSALLKRFDAPLHSTAPVSARIAAWRAEIQGLKGLSPHEQVERINDFMNKVPYVDDQQRYGPAGYWDATPERFFSDGGDCKDYALVKYTSLRALGFSPEQLRIAVVMDTTRNILHAILIVKESNISYVLDNQARNIEPLADVHRYQPIFAVNSTSWWKYSG
jgi:predicted transglutaminase-like cysteine proteinase